MRLRGYTDLDDYNVVTLLWTVVRPRCWDWGSDWEDQRLSWSYTWYDGPIWQLIVGPFWFAMGAGWDRWEKR